MSSIDSRIVEAKFENSQFLNGIKSTLDGLDSLKKGLQLNGATKGLSDIDSAAKKVSLESIGRGVDQIASKFNALTAIATAALAKITQQLVVSGESFLKSFTIAPITDGLNEYETQLNSIQTILANTHWEHVGLADVNKALGALNTYSDKTIYNFSEMARNVGTFTAAGVKLQTSVTAIKGIANLAAVSGSNAQQASTAMYQLSQALASGTVKLMDWNSVVNAGMGGKVFQDALIETAKVHGKNIDAMIKKEGSFRNTLQNGWLTSGILTETLAKFTAQDNAQTRALLKRQGYNEKQIEGIIKLGKTATDAATKVKTFHQLIDTLREAAGSGWGRTWQLILGNFGEAKKMWTDVNNVLSGFISSSAKARNKILGDWKAMGGRTVLLDGIKDAFNGLLTILRPIRDAFHDIFPPQTGATLLDLTKKFHAFADTIKIGPETADKLRRSFDGVFAVFHIIGQVISGVVSGIKDLFGAISGAGNSSGGLLNLTAGLGDFLVSVDKMLKDSGAIKSFFHGLAQVLAVPLKYLAALAQIVGHIFTGFDHHGASQVTGAFDSIGKKLNPVEAAFQHVLDFFSKAGGVLSNIGGKIKDAMSNIGEGISKAITPGTFDKALQVINTALIGGIALMFRNFFKGTGSFKVDIGGGLLESMKETVGATTGVLKSMQTQIKAEAIMKIAIAMGILTASIFILASIDGKKLAKAMAGVSIGIAGMSVSMAALAKKISTMGALKLPFIAAGMIEIAAAVLLLSLALKVMSTIDWNGLAKGLVGMAASLGIVVGAINLMPKNPVLVAQGAALVLFGVGLNAIAVALKVFGTMNWDSMSRGLTAMAGSLGIISGAIKLLPKTMALQAAGLLVLGAALNVIAGAMKIFGTIDFMATSKALVAMGGALGIIAGAIQLMPATMLLQAAGLLAVSVALNIIAGAMKILGTMGWDEIARGMTALAGSIAVLAGGLYLMTGSLAGAAALLVAAGALTVLTPIIITLGNLDWGTIIKALIALAATFAVLGVAGLALAPVTPVLLGLGAAVLLFGLGVAAVGAGVLLLSTGIGILVATLSAALQVIVEEGKSVITLIPSLLQSLGEGLGKGIAALASGIIKSMGTILKAFAGIFTGLLDIVIKYVPKIVGFFIDLLGKLLDGIVKLAPKMVKAMNVMLTLLIGVVIHNIPRLANAGLQMISGLLHALAANMDRLTTQGANVIIAFIQGISNQGVRIANAAMDAIIKFANGLAHAIEAHVGEFREAGKNLAFAIADGMTLGLTGKIGDVAGKAAEMAKGALNAAKHVLGIFSPSREFEKLGHYVDEGFAKGIIGGRAAVRAAWSNMHGFLRDAMETSAQDIADYEQKLKDLRQHATKNAGAIAQTEKKLAEARRENTLASEALKNLNQHYVDEYNHLQRLGKQYDIYTRKLDKANQKLADATQLRDDYKKSIIDQYSDLPDITNETRLSDFTKSEEMNLSDINKFIDTLAQLRKQGLSDQMYKELLSKGTAALPLAEEILAGGQTSISNVNNLGSEIAKAAKKLGNQASTSLYQAGVDAAQGIVDGLTKKRNKIRDAMEDIAREIVRALKKELKIKSPSKVMESIGRFVPHGLADGIKKTANVVSDASKYVGDEAVASMKQSLSGLSDLLAIETDVNPKIAPVLDLSDVRKQVPRLEAMMAGKQFSVLGSYSSAKDASNGYLANLNAFRDASEASASSTPVGITFNQYNNSPKSLSNAEIYRQTNNQLSRVKGALKPNAA